MLASALSEMQVVFLLLRLVTFVTKLLEVKFGVIVSSTDCIFRTFLHTAAGWGNPLAKSSYPALSYEHRHGLVTCDLTKSELSC